MLASPSPGTSGLAASWGGRNMGDGAVVAIQPANHVLSAPARSVGVRITKSRDGEARGVVWRLPATM